MKMSDVFDLPFTADAEFQEIYDASGEPLPDFESVEKDRAVVHAINSHDALVELNKELVKAFGDLIEEIDFNHSIRLENTIGASTRRSLTKAIDTLNKAKELLKDQG